ncbi:MAG: glyoxylate/hydroxypyruvate reductase A [Burkholderiales bacterium]|nr:glyoxylate/hydroxypyruvate reductase A [Burkholderiales bacterium]
MDVLFFAEDEDAPAWADVLASALPEARVHRFADGDKASCDYAVCWKPPADFFHGQSCLKAIMNLGAGVDAILDGRALPAGVPLVRVTDAGMGEQMEEYVAWCALRALRRTDDYARQQARSQWRQLPFTPRASFSIGIMGLGVLGARVARYLVGMGFAVRGWSRSRQAIAGVTCHAGADERAAFLAASNLLVCLLPLTEATRGILDRDLMLGLPAGAHVVGIGRGGHLIEADLLALLDNGHLAGATLDVFAAEPLPADSPLWRHPRITITPHISAQTVIEVSMRQIADKIRRIERGLPVDGLIDRVRGY